ncbi:hypothetical protein Tco_1157326 [Tanacetum coccineum]
MKESKAYKTYLGYATGDVPPKIARKFKQASPSKKESDLVHVDEKPITKGKRVKRYVKKYTMKPATGIDLLFEVALTEEAHMKEVRNKSLRDFHKTHPSGSGTFAKKPPRGDTITPTVTSEGTGDKPEVPDVTKDDSTESEYESWGNDEDDSNNEQELSDESSKQENESEEQESDSEQDEESNDDDQVEEEFDQENKSKDDEMKNARLEEPSKTATRIVQGEGNDTEMTEAQQGNENLETTQEQVVEDVYVTISTVPKKIEVPVTSSSCSSDLASKFLNFSKIPQTNAEIVSPLDVHELSNFAPPVIEKLIKESRDEVTLAKVSSQPQSTYEAASTLTEFELKKILLDKIEKSESYLTAPKHRDFYDSLKKSYALKKDFFYSYDVYSLKCGRKDKDKDENPSTGSDRGLKKRKTSKDAEPTTGLKMKDSTSGSSKGTKSQPKFTGKSVQSEEPVFEVADSDMLQDQAGNLGDNEDEPRDETACRRDWFKKPTPPQEPTDPD